jgi:hypothetical protein
MHNSDAISIDIGIAINYFSRSHHKKTPDQESIGECRSMCVFAPEWVDSFRMPLMAENRCNRQYLWAKSTVIRERSRHKKSPIRTRSGNAAQVMSSPHEWVDSFRMPLLAKIRCDRQYLWAKSTVIQERSHHKKTPSKFAIAAAPSGYVESRFGFTSAGSHT